MYVSRGYETTPTHVNKDRFALDFVQNGCESHGKEARAIHDGVISFINDRDSWGGGYGKNIILDHGDGRVSRYAHLHAYAPGIAHSKAVHRGEPLGYIGNTGNVVGVACREYPGTHLHFSVLKEHVPVKPEPISGYNRVDAYNWYLSDNDVLVPAAAPLEREKASWKEHLYNMIFSVFSRNKHVFQQPTTSFVSNGPVVGEKINTTTPVIDSRITGTFLVTSTSITVNDNQKNADVRLEIKNTGMATWPEEAVFVNVIGGANKHRAYYDPSWITALRPAGVRKKVFPGETVPLSFTITVPDEAHAEPLMLQLVQYNGGTFERIQNTSVRITIQRKAIERTPEEKNITQASLYIPEIQTVSDITSTEQENVPTGQSGGSFSSGNATVASVHVIDNTALKGESQFPELHNGPSTSSSILLVTSTGMTVASSTQGVEDQLVATTTVSSNASSLVVTSTVPVTSTAKEHIDVEKTATSSIQITEIAWMGTAGIKNAARDCTQHEWLELYNAGPQDVSLVGWNLYIHGSGVSTTIALAGSMPGNTYGAVMYRSAKGAAVLNVPTIVSSTLFSLPDTGAVITITNGKQEVVAMYDFSSGWPAGSTDGKFRPMEYVAQAWKTNAHITPYGETNGCGQLYGSPGRKNTGHVLLRNIVDEYAALFSEQQTLVLEAGGNPYIIDHTTVIPKGYTLVAKERVEFIGISSDAAVDVQGTFVLDGGHDALVEFVSHEEQPGQWSHISVAPGGVLRARYADFSYGGFPYSGTQGKKMSRVIDNNGGSVHLEHVSMQKNSPVSGSINHVLVSVEPTFNYDAELYISNSSFSDGYKAIHISGLANGRTVSSSILNSSFDNFTAPYGPIEIERDLSVLDTIHLTGNTENAIYLHNIQVATATVLPGMPYILAYAEIHQDGELVVAPGTSMRMLPGTDIVVKGTLLASGTDDLPITLTAFSERWGSILVDEGNITMDHATIDGGGLSSFSPQVSAVVSMRNASAAFNHVSIKNGRSPGVLFESVSSTAFVKNGHFVWEEGPDSTWVTTGMVLRGGSTEIQDTTFAGMTYGILADPGSIVTFDDREENDFADISGAAWLPSNIFEYQPGSDGASETSLF